MRKKKYPLLVVNSMAARRGATANDRPYPY